MIKKFKNLFVNGSFGAIQKSKTSSTVLSVCCPSLSSKTCCCSRRQKNPIPRPLHRQQHRQMRTMHFLQQTLPCPTCLPGPCLFAKTRSETCFLAYFHQASFSFSPVDPCMPMRISESCARPCANAIFGSAWLTSHASFYDRQGCPNHEHRWNTRPGNALARAGKKAKPNENLNTHATPHHAQ